MRNLFLLFLLGCSFFLKAEEQSASLLLDWTHNPLHVPLYIGQKLGFFKEAGTPLNLIENTAMANTLACLQDKKADLVISYMPNTMRASEQQELKVIGILVNQPLRALLVREDSPIHSIQDLQQARLGGSPSSLTTRYVCDVLARQGIYFNSIAPVRQSLQTDLQNNLVDVVVGAFWNIEPHQFLQEGFPTRFIKLSACGGPLYDELIIVCRTDWLKLWPDFPRSFQQALQKSIEFCQSNPLLAFEIYQDMHLSKEPWESAAWQSTRPLFSKTQSPDRARWKQFHQWMKNEGLVGQASSFESLIDELPEGESS